MNSEMLEIIFVTERLAIRAKEAGFNEPCLHRVKVKGKLPAGEEDEADDYLDYPTWTQLSDWMFKNYKQYVCPVYSPKNSLRENEHIFFLAFHQGHFDWNKE